MEAVPRKDANGANAIWRLVGKIAVIVSLTTAYVFVMQSSAFASGSLSSTILSIPEPGLVASSPRVIQRSDNPDEHRRCHGKQLRFHRRPGSALGRRRRHRLHTYLGSSAE